MCFCCLSHTLHPIVADISTINYWSGSGKSMGNGSFIHPNRTDHSSQWETQLAKTSRNAPSGLGKGMAQRHDPSSNKKYLRHDTQTADGHRWQVSQTRTNERLGTTFTPTPRKSSANFRSKLDQRHDGSRILNWASMEQHSRLGTAIADFRPSFVAVTLTTSILRLDQD